MSAFDPVVGVLALQGDVVEHTRALEQCSVRVVPVRRPDELATVDAMVLPGGESTTIDKLLRAFELMAPLRERIRNHMPVLGSCAGMILLADRVQDAAAHQQSIGGLDIVVRRNAFGRQIDSFEERLHAPALGAGPQDSPMAAVFIRAPLVMAVGAGVEVLARVRNGPHAGRIAAVRQGVLMATAFHPEISADHRVHRAFVALLRQSRKQ
ncbi:MAG: pyridoxal 5'-phosphate synthase glutaminase subunit PdxT [Beutenbergiaceae bacterium]